MRAVRRPGLLLLLALLASVPFAGSRGLYETTEGRYAEVAREMTESGDYLEPTLGYHPHWTKPPLAYWTVAAGLQLFGANAWGARIFNALAFGATALAVAALGAALWDRRTGWVAGLVYASSLFPLVGAANLSTDTVLTLWETLAVLAYALAWRADEGERRGWVWGMWICWGLAFLTKGPPALLPLLALLGFARFGRRAPRLLDPLGLALFVATGFGWYLVMVLRTPGLLGYWLGHEVAGRVASAEFNRNPQWYKPLVVYLPVLLFGPGLWLADFVRMLRRERLWRPREILRRIQLGDAGALLLLWLLLPLLVFSISRSRLPLYVLPLYAPVALAIARWMVRAGRDSPRRLWTLALATAALVGAGRAGSAYLYASPKDMRPLAAQVLRAGGPGARVRVFQGEGDREGKLYGLQFYLGGRLRRVTPTGREAWADAALRGAVAEARQARSTVFVTDVRAAPLLQGALVRTGVPFRRVELPGRELLLVGQ